MPQLNRTSFDPAWTDLAAGPSKEATDKPVTVDGGWRALLMRANAIELRVVRRLAGTTRLPALRSFTLAVNTLGNGWIYPPLLVALLLSGMRNARAIALVALLATLAAHALYALLKRGIARARPFEKDPSLVPLARVLDRYSFPSGHCMTLSAVLVPLVHVVPSGLPFAAGALCVLGWCRLASAHHYPSDVLAGACVGAAIAAPLSAWLLG